MTGTIELPAALPAGGRLPPRRVAGLLLADLAAAPAPRGRMPLGWRLRQRCKLLTDGSYLLPLVARVARRLGLFVGYGELYGAVIRGDGTVIDCGLLGRRVITNAGVAYLTADIAGGASDSNLFKFHAFGTGTTAENVTDTALVTELTTEYNPNSTRPTGSQSSSTNTYTTVGTLTPDSGGVLAITEHMILTQAATGGGTGWDRTKFAAVNLDSAAGDSLQATYTATFPAGG